MTIADQLNTLLTYGSPASAAPLGSAPIKPVRPVLVAGPRSRSAAIGPLAIPGDQYPQLKMPGTKAAEDEMNAPDPELAASGVAQGREPLFASKGLGALAEDWAMGMVQVPKGAGPISAFAYGLAGSIASAKSRKAKEAEAALAAEDRAIAADDRAFERSLKLRQEGRADREEARAELDARYDRAKTAAETEKLVTKEGRLTEKGMLEVEKLTIEYGKLLGLNPGGGMMVSPEERAAGVTMMEEYRKAVTDRLKEGLPLAQAAQEAQAAVEGQSTATGSTPRTVGELGRQLITGDGTQSAPFAGFTSVEQFLSKVPIGAYYIDENGVTQQRIK